MSKTPRDLAERMAARPRRNEDDGFMRETFKLPREAAREKARDYLRQYPAQAYMTAIDRYKVLPGDEVEFTMRRLRSAD